MPATITWIVRREYGHLNPEQKNKKPSASGSLDSSPVTAEDYKKFPCPPLSRLLPIVYVESRLKSTNTLYHWK